MHSSTRTRRRPLAIEHLSSVSHASPHQTVPPWEGRPTQPDQVVSPGRLTDAVGAQGGSVATEESLIVTMFLDDAIIRSWSLRSRALVSRRLSWLGMPQRSRHLAWGMILAVLAAVILAPAATLAGHVAPVTVAGDATCRDLGYSSGFRVRPVEAGTHEDPDSTFRVRLAIGGGPSGQTLDFGANTPVQGAIVGGGPDALWYDYMPFDPDHPRRLDDGLHAPIDPATGQYHELSRVTFCFGASLNVRATDEDGRRLPGAVFTVEGQSGTFTTGANGAFCITGLELDSELRVTQTKAPPGYRNRNASKLVEVDDSEDCKSPDAIFINPLIGPFARLIGPCGDPWYRAVFDNSGGLDTVRFTWRFISEGDVVKLHRTVPAGAKFRTGWRWVDGSKRTWIRSQTTGERYVNRVSAPRGNYGSCWKGFDQGLER